MTDFRSCQINFEESRKKRKYSMRTTDENIICSESKLPLKCDYAKRFTKLINEGFVILQYTVLQSYKS